LVLDEVSPRCATALIDVDEGRLLEMRLFGEATDALEAPGLRE